MAQSMELSNQTTGNQYSSSTQLAAENYSEHLRACSQCMTCVRWTSRAELRPGGDTISELYRCSIASLYAIRVCQEGGSGGTIAWSLFSYPGARCVLLSWGQRTSSSLRAEPYMVRRAEPNSYRLCSVRLLPCVQGSLTVGQVSSPVPHRQCDGQLCRSARRVCDGDENLEIVPEPDKRSWKSLPSQTSKFREKGRHDACRCHSN